MIDKQRTRAGETITDQGQLPDVEKDGSDQSHKKGLPEGEIRVDTLTDGQISEAAEILARSFSDDPNHRTLFPREKSRARVLRHEFTAACRAVLDLGHVYTASNGGTLSGVAVWVPPGKFPFSLRRQLRMVPELIRILAVAPSSARRLMQFSTGMEKLHPAQPYWYLLAVGVEPDMQGHGIGTKLLDPVLALADKTHQSCYLETASERNVAWYNELGFEVRSADISVTPGGPPNWTMLRQPGDR